MRYQEELTCNHAESSCFQLQWICIRIQSHVRASYATETKVTYLTVQGVNVTTTQTLPGGITNTRGPDYVGTSGVNIAGGSTLPGGTSESGVTNINTTTGTVSPSHL